MLYPVIFVFLILLIIALLLFLNTRGNVILKFVMGGFNDGTIVLSFSIGKFIIYKREMPLADIDARGLLKSLFYDDKNKSREGIIDYLRRKKSIIKEFSLKVNYGTGDAFSTGIIGGILWSLAGIITSFLEHNFRVYKKQVDIRPDYEKIVFNINLDCIFSLKTVHIILVGLKNLHDFLLRKIVGKKYKNEKER